MESIGLPLDDFDFGIDPFQSAGADGEVAVVQDSIFIATQSLDELAHPALSLLSTLV